MEMILDNWNGRNLNTQVLKSKEFSLAGGNREEGGRGEVRKIRSMIKTHPAIAGFEDESGQNTRVASRSGESPLSNNQQRKRTAA